MIKILLVFAAITITAGAYAQSDSAYRKMSSTTYQHQDTNQMKIQSHPVDKTLPDGVRMQNGKMMMVKNGHTTILDHDMTLSNGTKVMSTGTYVKKDGTKMMMKEGQYMDMSGNMVPMNSSKDKNMDLVPDTTRRK